MTLARALRSAKRRSTKLRSEVFVIWCGPDVYATDDGGYQSATDAELHGFYAPVDDNDIESIWDKGRETFTRGVIEA